MKLRIAKIQFRDKLGSREVLEYWNEEAQRWLPVDKWEFFSEEERDQYEHIEKEDDFLMERQRDLGFPW